MRSNWIICGSLLLTKFIAFLENISPSLIFDKKRKHPNKIQKHSNFGQFLPGKLQSSFKDRKIYALSGSLSQISAEVEGIYYYLLLWSLLSL